MKKLLATLLTLVMALSIGSAVFADPEPSPASTPTPVNNGATVTLNKQYVASDYSGKPETPAVKEKLKFTVDTVVYPDSVSADNVNLTINPVDGSNLTKITDFIEIPIVLPRYTVPGDYWYDVTESNNNGDNVPTQGVVYQNFTVGVRVRRVNGELMCYVVIHEGTHSALGDKIGGDGAGEGACLKNIYNVGALTVGKTVTGNMGDTAQLFDIDVTLKTQDGQYVRSDITVSHAAAPEEGAIQDPDLVIDGNGWTGEKTFTLRIRHGDTVTIHNLPAGVTYSVKEQAKHTQELNGDNLNNTGEGYVATYYALDTYDSGKVKLDTVTDGSTKPAAIGNAVSGVMVENNKQKDGDIPTGVSLDNLPYLLLLAGAVIALAVMVIKKRTSRSR